MLKQCLSFNLNTRLYSTLNNHLGGFFLYTNMPPNCCVGGAGSAEEGREMAWDVMAKIVGIARAATPFFSDDAGRSARVSSIQFLLSCVHNMQ
jgi:hypothetical protein